MSFEIALFTVRVHREYHHARLLLV